MQTRFALTGFGIFGEDNVQVCKRGVVVFALLVCQRALRERSGRLRTIREGLHVVSESFDYAGNIFRLDLAQAKFVGCFCAQRWGKLRCAQFPVNCRCLCIILLFVECFGF